MTKEEIIEEIAKAKLVEQIAEKITHSHRQEIKDLCQIVYLALLDTREDRLQDLYENNQMSYYIVRIILNQYKSDRSEFYSLYRKAQRKNDELVNEK